MTQYKKRRLAFGVPADFFKKKKGKANIFKTARSKDMLTAAGKETDILNNLKLKLKSPEAKKIFNITKSDKFKIMASNVKSLKGPKIPGNMTRSRNFTNITDPDASHSKADGYLRKYLKDGDATVSIGKGTTINIMEGPSDKGSMVPVSNIHSSIASKGAYNDEVKITHKTLFQTGKPSTKGVLLAKKVNGTVSGGIFDTKKDMDNLELRRLLTQEFGFNSKLMFIPPGAANLPIKDFLRVAGFNFDVESATSQNKVTTLLSVITLRQQFKIFNMNSTLPMKFKIHVCKAVLGEVLADPFNGFKFAFDSSLPLDTGADPSPTHIPTMYQHANFSTQAVGTDPKFRSGSCLVSNKLTSLNQSQSFRDRIQILKTFSKKLNHGDEWNFIHDHHCGPGLNLQDLVRQKNRGVAAPGGEENVMPMSYFFIFEASGYSSEAFIKLGPLATDIGLYNGTSNGAFGYEFKTSYYGVKIPTSSTTQIFPTAEGGNLHRREFLDSPSRYNQATEQIAKKERFVLPELMREGIAGLNFVGAGMVPIRGDHKKTIGHTTSAGARFNYL